MYVGWNGVNRNYLKIFKNQRKNVTCVTSYQTHIKFRNKVPSSSQATVQKWMSKMQCFVYHNCKVNGSKFSILIVTFLIFEKSKLIKTQWWSFSKKWLFPFLGHLCTTLGWLHLTSKDFLFVSLLFFIYLHEIKTKWGLYIPSLDILGETILRSIRPGWLKTDKLTNRNKTDRNIIRTI